MHAHARARTHTHAHAHTHMYRIANGRHSWKAIHGACVRAHAVQKNHVPTVKNSPPMGGCVVWWVGGWLGGLMGGVRSNH